VSGGENIHPEEIESHLLEFPGVAQTVVVPIPDLVYGNRPLAFVQWGEKQLPSEAGLREFLSLRLPKFKIPDCFLPWPKNRRHRHMKPSRRMLAELAQRYARRKQQG